MHPSLFSGCATILFTLFFLAFSSGATAQVKIWEAISIDRHRFQILANFNNEAVLDRETGLIWERTLSSEFPDPQTNWVVNCSVDRHTGGKYGWRLPTVAELSSLLKPPGAGEGGNAHPPNPAFFNYDPDASRKYWSATSAGYDPDHAMFLQIFLVDGDDGTSRPGVIISGESKTMANYAWCVRGGGNIN